MKEAVGYRITNKINGMTYNGIIYKDCNIARRFEEHMSGKGGVLLFEKGVCVYGRDCFIIEEICRGSLSDVREWEYQQNINNLWPHGYNGNAGKVIVRTDETAAKRKISITRYLNNRTEADIKLQNEKRARTVAMRSKEEVELIKQKLSSSSKKFWDNMTVEERKEFTAKRGKSKSESYKSQTDEYKESIRNKIREASCKKMYKSPTGVYRSTVDGSRVEGISPALFNYRCKSDNYPDWEILST
jgi:hypothetical protein